jgi:hypothetical protein
MGSELLVDAILSWVGALGVLGYLLHIQRSAGRSFVEGRMRFLLGCIGILLIVRGASCWEPGRWIQVVAVPAALVPLAMHLFVEGLLRRHLPRAMKAFVAAGTALFLGASLAGLLYSSDGWNLAFLGFQCLTLALLFGFLLLRRRASLSPPENRLVDLVTLAAACAVPLAATDFRAVHGLADVRLGPLGALLFVYVCVRSVEQADLREVLVRDAARLLLRTLVVALPLLALQVGGAGRWPACAALSAALVLLLTTWDHLWALSEQSRRRSFLRWLLDSDWRSPAAFLDGLRSCPVAEQHLVFDAGQLEQFALGPMLARLAGAQRVLGRSSLRRSLASRSSPEFEADDQLLALLDTHGMSHVFLASADPPVLMLLNYPELSAGKLAELEMALVQKLARSVRER